MVLIARDESSALLWVVGVERRRGQSCCLFWARPCIQPQLIHLQGDPLPSPNRPKTDRQMRAPRASRGPPRRRARPATAWYMYEWRMARAMGNERTGFDSLDSTRLRSLFQKNFANCAANSERGYRTTTAALPLLRRRSSSSWPPTVHSIEPSIVSPAS